jgi:hypothetical protein
MIVLVVALNLIGSPDIPDSEPDNPSSIQKQKQPVKEEISSSKHKPYCPEKRDLLDTVWWDNCYN